MSLSISSGGADRRRFLRGAAAAGLLLAGGCRGGRTADGDSDQADTGGRSTQPSSVALRIVLVGSEADADAIRRGWSSIAEQAIEIRVLGGSRADLDADAVSEAARTADAIVAPAALSATLLADGSIVKWNGDAIEDWVDELPAGVREAIATIDDQIVALPLASGQPAIIGAEPIPAISNWSDYDQWVDRLDGAAAEPVGAGWAAFSFLNRAAATCSPWLFGVDTADPVIDSVPYVSALTQMVETVAACGIDPRTPGVAARPELIWAAVDDGRLAGGIGYPPRDATEGITPNLESLPVGDSARLLTDPFVPALFLSSRCRQSSATRTWATWLASDTDASTLRRRSFGASPWASTSVGDVFDDYVARRYAATLPLAGFAIVRGLEYYAALDEQIIAALAGETEPQAALSKAARRWRMITTDVGVDIQNAAWLRQL